MSLTPWWIRGMDTTSAARGKRYAWYLYDWANSAFATIIITFVFSVYMTREVMGDSVDGSAYWSLTIALSGILIAISAPLLGLLADRHQRTMCLLRITSLACILLTAGLVLVHPGMDWPLILLALSVIALANAASELSYVVYNAMLPAIAGTRQMGRVSGTAWGIGYLGGIACLGLVLVLCIGVGAVKPVLPTTDHFNVRASALVVAGWYLLFAWPLLMLRLPDQTVAQPTGLTGPGQLKQTFKDVWAMPDLFRLLVASALYRDGLATLFAVGGTFAAAAFDMGYQQIMVFAIGLNVSAGIGAIALARLDDRLGSKPTIALSLTGLIVTGIIILFLQDKWAFIAVALVLGVFVGPVQAASRTFVSRLAPAEQRARIFGLYAFSGKAIAFLGPLAYGGFTLISGSARIGLLAILGFWLAGLLILLSVRERLGR